MDWINNLIFGHSAAHTVFVLSAVIILGVLIGRVGVKGISFGIGGVLFSGLLFGHFSMGINAEVLEFVREFGIILFVYSIGMQAGPAFLASFRRQGLMLNALAAGIVFTGVFTAVIILWTTGLPAAVVAGIMSGAVTNTPGLGAAQQAVQDICAKNPELWKMPGLGYAMSYPFGVIGVIFTILLCRRIFRVNVEEEAEKFRQEQAQASMAPSEFSIIVSNPRAAGKSIEKIMSLAEGDFVIPQINRNGKAIIAKQDTLLELGDIISVVCRRETFENLVMLCGDMTEFDMKSSPGALISETIVATRREVFKKTIGELDLNGRFGISVTKIGRGGVELLPRPSIRLQFGDELSIVGDEEGIKQASAELGDSVKDLEHPNILPIFLGIIIGVVIGIIPIPVPGLSVPVKLGIAGGPLLVAVILSGIRQIGPLNWHLHPGANLILREIGITLFLACVGLKSGESFVATLTDGDGVYWMGLGMIITFVPVFTAVLAARLVFKMNFLSICGLISGSVTNPPALSFSVKMAESDAPAITYAAVYSLAMLLRISAAQLFIIIFS